MTYHRMGWSKITHGEKGSGLEISVSNLNLIEAWIV
jgi:hypothetical protein